MGGLFAVEHRLCLQGLSAMYAFQLALGCLVFGGLVEELAHLVDTFTPRPTPPVTHRAQIGYIFNSTQDQTDMHAPAVGQDHFLVAGTVVRSVPSNSA